MAGIPFAPVHSVAGAIFLAATDDNLKTDGCAWLFDGDGPVVQVRKDELKGGLYQMLDDRRSSLERFDAFLVGYSRT
ncbi:hypothetical protein HYDPIDRAFT_111546 [Hydnomerulius pinastri MD-312]|uniref:Uncharacterized protein n=1 Tax=Hydnomerulius pinastri MD-312 TaxID=994086 RepID=A0A0C9W1S3_9AGAM|nr:hypothetical protein HYDPIDRAFT_111546 [Hydnomerulius pinastri MD-312]